MVLDKGLLLKGLAGVGALGTVTIVGVGASGLMGESEEGKMDRRMGEVNVKLNSLGLGNCLLANNNFSNPTTFSRECDLNKDQFKKIPFSNMGEGDVNVGGWTDSNNIKLVISNGGEGDNGIKFLFKDHPSNLTITKSEAEQTEKITIRANKDTEFEATEDNKLRKKVDETLKEKFESHNTKLEALKFPENCRFDVTENDEHLDCGIAEEELKKMEFSNKEGENPLTLEGYENGKIAVKIERVKTEEPETLKYIFKNNSTTNNLTISGSGSKSSEKIVIRKGKETEFVERDDKLNKKGNESLKAKLDGHNTKLGTLKLPEGCRFDNTEDDPSLECSLEENDLKKMEFSNKGDTESTIGGYDSSKKVTLKVERVKTQDPETLKYTFKNNGSGLLTISGQSGKPKITLRGNVEREFKENENKLTKRVQNEEVSVKLNNYNIEKLQLLSLPESCIFDDTETNTTLTCDITSTDLPKIKFSIKENGDLTLAEGEGFTGLKLEIKEKNNDLSFIFKNVSEKIKLTGNSNKSVYLKKSENSEFEFKNNALHKIPKKVNELASKVNLICEYGDDGNSGSCTLSGTFLNVSTTETGEAKAQSIHFGSSGDALKENAKFTFEEDQSAYEDNIKFTFTGENIEKSGNTEYKGKLVKNKSYEVKSVGGVNSLSLKNPQ